MKRLATRTEPFHCSPETPHGDCPGYPRGHGKNHGSGSDEWYFTVLHGDRATTLTVFGTDVHEGMPADHPSRDYWNSRGARGGGLSVCKPAKSVEGQDNCPYLDKPCEQDGVSYTVGHSLWTNAGNPGAKLKQADPFWEALELVARSWCESSCCEALTDAEEAKLRPLLALASPGRNE